MALKGLQSKINVLETVRQKVPGRRTGIDKRLSISVNSYWAQGLKPLHFYDHGARLYDEPPTFVTT